MCVCVWNHFSQSCNLPWECAPLMSGAQTQRFWFNWPLCLPPGSWVFTAPGRYWSAMCWGPRSLNRLQMEWLTSWWLYPFLPLVIFWGSPGPRSTSLVLPAGLWEAAALSRDSLWFSPQPRRPLGAPPAAAAARWAPAGARKGLLGGLFRRLVLSGLVLLSLFFFPFIFIRWRLITLQYCSGFCRALTWISHGFTCVPHPDPPSHLPPHPIPLGHPSAPAPSTCLMHPAWAGICFTLDSIHISMLLSQSTPPSPSPTESQSLFCTSVSFPVLHIELSLPSF